MIFTYCAILLAYAVTAFALYQRADSPHIAGPTAGPILSAPQGFALTSLLSNGTSCPPGSTYYALNRNRTAITVYLTKYSTRAGPSYPIGGNRALCQLSFGVDVPPGFTYYLTSVDYYGYYQLDVNVTASQQVIYYFNEPMLEATVRSQLVGPLEGKEYTYRDYIDSVTPVLAPCGVASVMNLQSEHRISNSRNRKGTGYIGGDADSIDTQFEIAFNLQWQKCSP